MRESRHNHTIILGISMLLLLLTPSSFLSALLATGLATGMACSEALSENAIDLLQGAKPKRGITITLISALAPCVLLPRYWPNGFEAYAPLVVFVLSVTTAFRSATAIEEKRAAGYSDRGLPPDSNRNLRSCLLLHIVLLGAYLKTLVLVADEICVLPLSPRTTLNALGIPCLMLVACLLLVGKGGLSSLLQIRKASQLTAPLLFAFGLLLLGLGPLGRIRLVSFTEAGLKPSMDYYLIAIFTLILIFAFRLRLNSSPSTRNKCSVPCNFVNLSDRESEILCDAMSGKTIADTASRLGISIGAVGEYRRRVLRKTGAKSLLELHYANQAHRAAPSRLGQLCQSLPLAPYGFLALAASPLAIGIGLAERKAQFSSPPLSVLCLTSFAFLLAMTAKPQLIESSARDGRPTSIAKVSAIVGCLLLTGSCELLFEMRRMGTTTFVIVMTVQLAIAAALTYARCGDAAGTGILLGTTPLSGLTVFSPEGCVIAGAAFACMGSALALRELASLKSSPTLSTEEHLKGLGLTPAEIRVALLLSTGMKAADVADDLIVSKATVATHRKSIYKKLDVHSQHELIVKVSSMGNSGRSG